MDIKFTTTIAAIPIALALSAAALAATIENPSGMSAPILFGTAVPDTITNYGTVGSLYGNGLDGYGGDNVIINYGDAGWILGSQNMIGDGGSNTISNFGTSFVIGGSYNQGPYVNGGSNIMSNFGSTSEFVGSYNWGDNSSGGFNTLFNFGTTSIIVGTGNLVGVNTKGGSNTIVNSGTVMGLGPTIGAPPTIVFGIVGSYNLGSGSSGGGNTIINSGKVTGDVVGSLNLGPGSSGGGNIILNSGIVNGDIVGSWNLGAGSSSTGNTIANSGTVNGDIWGSRDEGPGAVGGDDTITNSGIVSGSIFGGTGNDTIIHVGGSSLGGVADGGPGSDELGFDNMGSLDGSLLDTVYLSFENLGIYGGRTSLSGTWDFSGGQATVYSGNLNLRGSLIADTLTVKSGGVLTGTGRFSGRLVNFGTISPGNSIGSLHVSGSTTFMPGSVFLAEIRPSGASDRLSVNGPVSLRGGTVRTALSRSLYT
ncbi:MAG: hypothetical protein F9K32_12015, partial [Desulfobulbaceae bacterium]